MTTTNPLSDLGRSTADTAARLTQISIDSAERTLAIQLEFAKASPDPAPSQLTRDVYAG